MLFPESFIEDLKQRLPISKLIGSRVKLSRRGANYLGCCPFHQEKTPSFTVSDQKGSYYCFGCHAHGDIIQFVSETDKLSFADTITYLANIAGVELPKLKPEDKKKIDTQNSLIEVVAKANNWFVKQLKLSSNHQAYEYLLNRKLNEQDINNFSIGYAPAKGLIKYLQAEGISLDFMMEAGLIIKTENKDYIERFRERIIFPIFNQKNQVVGFGGRSLDAEKMPKYLNSPETALFKKNNLLYGLNFAYKNILKNKRLIIVEGYIDTIFMHKAGLTETVAALGTAFNQTHLQNLWRLAEEPILCFDGDSAGKKAMLRAAHVALPLLLPGLSLKFCFLPKGQDPDEIINRYGVSYINNLLENSVSLSDFIWQSELEQHKLDSPENRALFEHKINALVDDIQNPVVKSHYRQYIKEKLWKEFNQNSKNNFNKFVKAKKVEIKTARDALFTKNITLKNRLEYSLFAQLINYSFLINDNEIFEQLMHLEIENQELEALRELFIFYHENNEISLNELLINKNLGNLINFLCGPESSFVDNISVVDNNKAKLIWLITHRKQLLELLKEEYNHLMRKTQHEQSAYEKATELKISIDALIKEIIDQENILTSE